MKEIKFVVEGKPQAKQRPRATRIHGYNRIYTPRKTANYEKSVAIAYKKAGGKRFEQCAIEIMIDAYFASPSKVSKKKREALIGTYYMKHKGDLDNICKSILDGLNNVAYSDDVQVVKLEAVKRYGSKDCVVVSVKGEIDEQKEDKNKL